VNTSPFLYGLLAVLAFIVLATILGKFLNNNQKRYPSVTKYGHLLGAIVIEVECNGCMASEHKNKRIGQIIRIAKGKDIWSESPYNNYDYAVCRIIDSHQDNPETFFHVCVQDGSFQLAPNSVGYFWYR
jgi:hypothetical protein